LLILLLAEIALTRWRGGHISHKRKNQFPGN
jgi:hypothetical protein